MTNENAPSEAAATDPPAEPKSDHESLKYSLLGPSLTKAGQDKVDQAKVSEIIYAASKGSKYFHREEEKDKILTTKITALLAKKAHLESSPSLLARPLRAADALLAALEHGRDLSQHVVHVDCDAFYAAVEQLAQPRLATVPFAVGAGVLTTCNYLARKFGCRSGMAGFVAKKLCPELELIRPDFAKYAAKAQEVRAVLARYDPRFESTSIDEAYLNITAYCDEHGLDPAAAVARMRAEVHAHTGVTVSAGIAANATLAKICSNMNKPDGQFVLARERGAIVRFMNVLPVRKVNGVGRVLERELAAVGVHTCGDLYQARGLLAPLFGDKTAAFLLGVHLGLGRTSVQPAEEHERKSVGTERTFHETSDPAELRTILKKTAEELEKDLARNEVRGRTLCLKVKMHTYEVFTRQVAVAPRAVQAADELYRCALPMLERLEAEMPGMKLRLMGLRATHLVSTKKPDAMAFFGFKRRKREEEETHDDFVEAQRAGAEEDEDEEWEQWPDGMQLGEEEEEQGGGVLDALAAREFGPESASRHDGKETAPNAKPQAEEEKEQEDWWACPICGRPQATDERQFNEHIDLCLSRQTIRDAVKQDAAAVGGAGTKHGQASRSTSAEPRKTRPEASAKKKRGRPPGRPPAAPDPRQKRLCFG